MFMALLSQLLNENLTLSLLHILGALIFQYVNKIIAIYHFFVFSLYWERFNLQWNCSNIYLLEWQSSLEDWSKLPLQWRVPSPLLLGAPFFLSLAYKIWAYSNSHVGCSVPMLPFSKAVSYLMWIDLNLDILLTWWSLGHQWAAPNYASEARRKTISGSASG